jgi:hypothetical protein
MWDAQRAIASRLFPRQHMFLVPFSAGYPLIDAGGLVEMSKVWLWIALLSAGTAFADDPETIRGVPSKQIPDKVKLWPECDEYKSADRCKVTIYLGGTPQPNSDAGPWMPHAHWDVQVKPFIFLKEKPRGEAAVVLQQSSPFLQCTVAATPAAPTRDLSANIAALLTAGAGIGALQATANVLQGGQFNAAAEAAARFPPAERGARLSTLAQIEADLGAVARDINNPDDAYHAYLKALQADKSYSYPNDPAAIAAIEDLKSKTAAALVAPLPDYASFGSRLNDLRVRLLAYATGAPPSEQQRIAADMDLIVRLTAEVTTAAEALKDENSRRKSMRQLYDFLWGLDEKSPLTSQILPMAYFSGKTVTETVTCKDAISNNQAFDNIVFTAYYEGLPHVDISAGTIFSLLGGRQVGSVTSPWTPAQQSACPTPATTPCGPNTVLADTSKSWYQFMPGVFVEWRWVNFLPHWVKNGSPVHKLGYLWSFGPVAGVDINPNNGTTEGEFFEGFSLGIQRFSIMAGFHDGRYQQYTGGYYVGEVFPTGTTVTPPTVRNWAVRPAFGIAYRIPIR